MGAAALASMRRGVSPKRGSERAIVMATPSIEVAGAATHHSCHVRWHENYGALNVYLVQSVRVVCSEKILFSVG